jgi:hypothetical protein
VANDGTERQYGYLGLAEGRTEVVERYRLHGPPGPPGLDALLSPTAQRGRGSMAVFDIRPEARRSDP